MTRGPTNERTWRRTLALIGLALFVAASGVSRLIDYDNSKSRYLALSALVDRGTFSIDAEQGFTIDKASHAGRWYSNKAPGAVLIAAPLYSALRVSGLLRPLPALRDRTLLDDQTAKWLIRVWTASLPFALCGVLLARRLRLWGLSARAAARGALAYGLGSVALLHAASFSGHETAACLLYFSFEVALQADGRASWNAAAGACAALAGLCEYPAWTLALALLAVAARRGGRRAALPFAAALGAGAAALAAYDFACFGSPWALSYASSVSGSVQPSVAQGLYGVSWPRPAALLALVGSPAHGLYFLSPWLLWAIPGARRLARERGREGAARLAAAGALIPLLIAAGYFGWHGGWGYGPRYLVFGLPFVALAAGYAMPPGPILTAALGLSFLQILLAQAGVSDVPPNVLNPLPEFVIPLMKQGVLPASLGGLLGLPGAWGSLATIALAGALGAAALASAGKTAPLAREKVGGFSSAVALWCLVAGAALVLVRSPDGEAEKARDFVFHNYAAAEALGGVWRR